MKELESALLLFIIVNIIGERTSFGSNLAIKREDYTRFAFFQKVEEDKALEGHVVSTYLVFSELDCLHKCLSCARCASFNFQYFGSELHHACELNDVTQSLSGHILTFRGGFYYCEPLLLSNEGQGSPPRIINAPQPTASSSGQGLLQKSPMTSSAALVQYTSPTMFTVALPMTSPTMFTAVLPMTSSALLASSSSVMVESIASTAALLPSTSPTTSLMASSSVVQPADCTNGWQQYRTGCIKYFTGSKTRGQAKQECAKYKTSSNVAGKLVKILSSDENNKLVSLAPQAGRYYIGLSDWATEGTYQWMGSSDTVTYFNWMSGYPQNYNIEKNCDCAVLSTHPDSSYKKWLTVECTNSWSFVCECENACA